MYDSGRLSRIETEWTMVRDVANQSASKARVAHEQLLCRYGGAVRRYLLGALRDPAAADDAFQEFALRVVRGDFRNADPGKGRFRNFLKTVVYRLAVDHQRRARRDMAQVDVEAIVEPMDAGELDARFIESWRDHILATCWTALGDDEAESGRPYHTVLRYRADHPDESSQELAKALSLQIGKRLTAGNIRVILHRARDRFADRVIDEVMQSMPGASLDQVEQELLDLNLLAYCRSNFDRRALS